MPFQALAEQNPGKLAAVMAVSGRGLTYGELERQSCQLAQLLRDRGLQPWDRIAVLMENNLEWFVAMWGARRAGLLFVPVNWHFKPAEIRYCVEDSGAKAIVTSSRLVEVARDVVAGLDAVAVKLVAGAATADFESLAEAIEAYPETPIPGVIDGGMMPYSSGTSGKPKGIERPRNTNLFGAPPAVEPVYVALYGFGPQTVYLSPAPQYHSAPTAYAMMVQDVGGTVVSMENFDAETALRTIDVRRVTHAQFVPTHFTRMLALPAEIRERYDHSTLGVVIHAAAPCPRELKLAMMNWWGPILYEFYGGSESFGSTAIGPEEWLAHQGSVGRGLGPVRIHVVDIETGKEVDTGTIGVVYLEGGSVSSYHKDEQKTADARNEFGWRTYGDLGWLDADGYLYLSDRRSNMINSGGVNIYPQEVENHLAVHPGISDVAVIGVPNAEFGEEVKAVVIPADPARADAAFAQALIEYCREGLANYKCPRTVDFVDALPRYPNGKLHKRELQERYWTSLSNAGPTAQSTSKSEASVHEQS